MESDIFSNIHSIHSSAMGEPIELKRNAMERVPAEPSLARAVAFMAEHLFPGITDVDGMGILHDLEDRPV